MTKNVAITGHTKGIGKEIYNYFAIQNYQMQGFSRSNNFDISIEQDRNRIIESSKKCDIFVNNAYNNFDNSQQLLLEEMINLWFNMDKTIINISSRWTTDNHKYCYDKSNLDDICEKYKNNKLYIINLKPGLIDTTRVKNISGIRMHATVVTTILDFILKNQNDFRVHSISFGKDF